MLFPGLPWPNSGTCSKNCASYLEFCKSTAKYDTLAVPDAGAASMDGKTSLPSVTEPIGMHLRSASKSVLAANGAPLAAPLAVAVSVALPNRPNLAQAVPKGVGAQ
jgi:hypothetical protein